MMRPLGIGLAIATLFASLLGASATFAADKDDAMAAAAPLLQQKQVPCTVIDARTIKKNADLADGAKASFYEVACQDTLGFVVIKRSKEPMVQAEDCLLASKPTADGKPNALACKLPENVDPKPALSKVLTKAGHDCTVDNVRGSGMNDAQSISETSCQGGAGYILMLPIGPGGELVANPCMGYDELANSPLKCTLTTQQQREARLQALASAGGKPCTVKAHHFIGTTPDKSEYIEVACDNGKGYVIETDAGDKFKEQIDCAMAAGIAGGCTLTDTRAAQTEQNGTYSKLAKKAGFNCDVAKYAAFAVTDPKLDVVELQCSNRPDGGIGIFPATGQGRVLDCVRSQAEGFKCTFSKESDVYPQLFAQLKAKGKTSCQVNGARAAGRTQAGDDFVEVSCSDGNPGWVMEYPANADAPSAVLSCPQFAAQASSSCELPTNQTKK